jgi:hypothetical protein
MIKNKLKVLAGVFFIVFALFPPPNVTATNLIWIYAGRCDTDTYDEPTAPTSVVSEVPDSYEKEIASTNGFRFYMDWAAEDHDSPVGPGSNHTHTLFIDPSNDDPTEVNNYIDLAGDNRDGTIEIIYPAPHSADMTYEVTVNCKAADKDTSQKAEDSDSFTLTVDVPPHD